MGTPPPATPLPDSLPVPPEQWFLKPDWHMVWLTGLLFIVGIATAFIFYRQFGEMKEQTRILNEQAKQAAADTIEAGDRVDRQLGFAAQQVQAAQDSVKAIQRQMRQDQRAWVTFSPVSGVSWQKTADGLCGVSTQLQYINVGKTAARHLIEEVVLEVVKNGNSPSFDYKHTAHQLGSTGIVLPQKPETFTAQLSKPVAANPILGEPRFLSASEYRAMVDGEYYLAIYGRIRYQDIFNVPHWTKYCEFSAPSTGRSFTAKACTDYNNVDSNN
jgi:hypothetical protein